MTARLPSAPRPAGPTPGDANLPQATCAERPVTQRMSYSPFPKEHLALAALGRRGARARSGSWSSHAGRLALAVCLSLAPLPASAAPPPASERDLAYERAVQAEEASDHAAAAAHYERAFRLTSPAETGPRLLFLRSSVAARQRAFDGSSDARTHLCPARALLREHLDATAAAPAGPGDPTVAERDSLTKIEQQLTSSRIDCTAEPDAAPEPPNPTSDAPTDPPATEPDRPAPESAKPPATKPVGPEPLQPLARPASTRNRRFVGAAFGTGAVGLAAMTVGIVLAVDARKDGFALCRSGPEACDYYAVEKIRLRGRAGNGLLATGATLATLGLVTGIVLLAISKRPARSRVAITPNLTGLTLSARF